MTFAAAMFRPHDLIRFDPSALVGQDLPDWVTGSVQAAAFAVVRRAECRGSMLPIGLRGNERHQRWGTWLDHAAVIEHFAPEALVPRIASLPDDRLASVPALTALPELAARLLPAGWRWGPTGSVGFELATGRATAQQSSDLDLIIRCDAPITIDAAHALLAHSRDLGVRCDMLLETPLGATALVEFAKTTFGPVVTRTTTGPRLVATPWSKE
jgi:phosphoribosyl-dephospho-CoA transferase